MKRSPLKRAAAPKRKRPMKRVALRASSGTCTFRVPSIKRKRPGKPRRVSVIRDRGFLEFLRESPCAVSGKSFYRNQPAHGPVNGRSSKGGDNEAIPLTAALHREQHRIGWKAFEAKYGIDRAAIAAEHWKRYLIDKESKKMTPVQPRSQQ